MITPGPVSAAACLSPGTVSSKERDCVVLVQREQITDVDEQAASLTGWSQRYDQLSPGRFEGSVTECWVDGLQFIRERSRQRVHQVAHAWAGARMFLIPAAQSGTVRFGNQVMDASMPVTLGTEEELDFRTPLDMDMMSVVLDAATVASFSGATEGTNLDVVLRNFYCLPADSPGLAELRALFSSIFDIFQHSPVLLDYPEVRTGLCHALLTRLFSTFSAPGTQGGHRRIAAYRRVVDRARDYVLENTLKPVTIPELCMVLGVSRRTLQTCFQQVMGTNPVQYLRAVRLNRVRRALREGGAGQTTVQDVACRSGFWHLSSFTAEYKKMFGELPSQTLMKAR